MKLLRWIAMSVSVAALTSSTPTAADAQTCSGSRFATCATVVAAPVIMGVALLSLQEPFRPAFFTAAVKNSANANDGCPSPNGENGAATVSTHNPHCTAADVDPTVAPEPASIVLLGTALVTLGAGMFTRRRVV